MHCDCLCWEERIVRSNEGLLCPSFDNLLSSAIEFSLPRSSVTTTVLVVRDQATLNVRNTTRDLTAQELELMLEPSGAGTLQA